MRTTGVSEVPSLPPIYFAGSVKWLQSPFDGRDLAALDRAAPSIPGFNPETAGLVAVSRASVSDRIDRSRLGLVWSLRIYSTPRGDRVDELRVCVGVHSKS